MRGSSDSSRFGPSRNHEPRPRKRILLPVCSAISFMFCPEGPSKRRPTRNKGSSSMPTMNWPCILPPDCSFFLQLEAWPLPLPFLPRVSLDSSDHLRGCSAVWNCTSPVPASSDVDLFALTHHFMAPLGEVFG
eukprot:CAMPEP_0197641062 /NCGR_PEP_ID=MMETSP1338-20131121/15131_1 /TAXON_ID=43686 ORGANISM="Pelagodinium beii, Strain RCC1491" /NCGR_SAMPLE_ID=MMETSP1338 /ASSEMBLY_ACC=CAM_ASM_000754 /LENGTH=132 /DNA_ID=CAMNT_0043213967 /DNA_START=291 /DNA_END=689 /DNA_ORIENTATION=+